VCCERGVYPRLGFGLERGHVCAVTGPCGRIGGVLGLEQVQAA
jgi:hypothetical protein